MYPLSFLISKSLSFANLVHSERPDGPAAGPKPGDLNKLSFCSKPGDLYPQNARGPDKWLAPWTVDRLRAHSQSPKNHLPE